MKAKLSAHRLANDFNFWEIDQIIQYLFLGYDEKKKIVIERSIVNKDIAEKIFIILSYNNYFIELNKLRNRHIHYLGSTPNISPKYVRDIVIKCHEIIGLLKSNK